MAEGLVKNDSTQITWEMRWWHVLNLIELGYL